MWRLSFYLYLSLTFSLIACRSKEHGVPDGGDGGYIDYNQTAAERADTIFSSDELPSFHLTLSEEALAGLAQDPLTYQPGTIRYVSEDGSEDITLVGAGIRLKGRASFQPIDEKPSFKIKLSEFVSFQRLKGLRRLTLNNMVQDPSMARERLGYRFLRELGAPAPRCNSARVYVNDAYYGLYANVESLDESFLEVHFSPPDGNLYETTNDEYFIDILPGNEHLFELETNQSLNDTSDLLRLMEALDGPEQTFVADASSVLDLDEFLLVGAGQAVMADWDGYFGASNNYKIYHDVVSDLFALLHWGIDQTFNIIAGEHTMLDYNIDGSNSERPNGVVFTKCKADDTCHSRYLRSVSRAVAVFDGLGLEAELDHILAQIADAASEDTRQPYSADDVDYSIERVREFIRERGNIVREQLAR